ncbi:MBOAT family protein [Rasiella rasia]|uniref:MBOAT family protein n=1 Tax=Rasiella rasia TaxID=2744027 RepID=A0A6G6GQ01_9FLAO|nr:MBOAT family protein [Rasiella rasia]QIE60628.1 MBOAT family protein [Rasiella rasia]
MLFNSVDFALFLPIVFMLYWFVCRKKIRAQNWLLLLSSYFFYGFWDWRFLFLILFSTLVDFSVARRLLKEANARKRKLLVSVSILVNLGLLGFFKYYNFFLDTFVDSFSFFGTSISIDRLDIILPVGISFYTFQTLSYTIDVYRKKITSPSSFLNFAAYVSFFPQLVAGPIERATKLLPQFSKERIFRASYALSGLDLMIWGLFKKVVIADNCAFFVNQIFDNPGAYSSAELATGAVLFGFQIYGDFSGYSDIAIGTARLFGFDLMLNFKFPYFSRDIAEFWRRWHISLSTWFRDYLYIPLGGSRGTLGFQIRNVFIVFVVSGFWHGASWNFIIWGAIHAILFLPLLIAKKNRSNLNFNRFSIKSVFNIVGTFMLVNIAWIFFRADTLQIAYNYIKTMLTDGSLSMGVFTSSSKSLLFFAIILISVLTLLLFEYFSIKKKRDLVLFNRVSAIVIVLMIVFFGAFKNASEFIYFQF